jgi:hypothetical protein
MNFGEILNGKYRYAFTDAICYISVRSIEDEYNRIYQISNRKPPGDMFQSFMMREAEISYPTVDRVYNFVMLNPRKMIMSRDDCLARMTQLATVPIDAKLAQLIQVETITGNTYIHPMLAIMFAINMGRSFAVEIIGHISGLRLAGCDSGTHTGRLWEEIDERDITINEYKRSARLCGIAVNDLQDKLADANRAIESLRTENEKLSILLNEMQTAHVSRCAKICNWLRKIGRNRAVSPESFRSM